MNEENQKGLVELILYILGISILWAICYFTIVLWIVIGLIVLLVFGIGLKEAIENGTLLNFSIVVGAIVFFIVSAGNGVNYLIIFLVLALIGVIVYQLRR